LGTAFTKNVKKMCTLSTSKTLANTLGFTYPKLHEGKRWFVDFFCYDPAIGELRRKRYYLPDNLKVKEKRRRGAEILESVTRSLRSGWTPWAGKQDTRGYTLLEDCFDLYLKYIGKKSREKTKASYRSRINMIRLYNEKRMIPIKYAYQYDEVFVNEYLDWLIMDREVSATTRNNYRDWCCGFADWMIARNYIRHNPAEKIPQMREEEKKRKDLSQKKLKEMVAHLKVVDKYFLLACYMEYYTFIRPTELTYVKVGDISVKEQSIQVHGEHSKNHRDSKVGLNKRVIKLMIELNVLSMPNDYYLFGKNFRPSKDRIGPDQFNHRWKKMREALGWSDVYQFYSLKDSGIRDLANEKGVVIARDQARHQDVTTTNRYIQRDRMTVHEETLDFEGGLGEDD